MKNISLFFNIFKHLPFEKHPRSGNLGRTVSWKLQTEKGDPGGTVYELGKTKRKRIDPFLRNLLEKL